MKECRLDFETRSDIDLKTRGSGPYFASPHFKALILCYSIDNGPVQEWTFGKACPADLREHIESGGYIRAFNASFERQCFEQLHAREGWPLPAIDRYRCTAAEAAAMSLPRSLAGVGEALGLPVQKDKRGMALIRKFSIPRRARKGEAENGLYWNEPHEFPQEFAEFVAYCRQDVETEAAAGARIVPLSDYEQAVYTLDQAINKRGIRIDIRSAVAAIELAAKAKSRLDNEMCIATGGYVRKCSEPGKLVEWVQSQGIDMSSAAKAEVAELLSFEDLPESVRLAIETRQEAAKTSVAKLQAMVNRADADGRVRNSFLMYGAGTGRWTNMGVNFANMPRPRKIYEDAHLDTALLFENIREASPEILQFMYGPELGRPLHLVSDAIRGFVWASPGHEFVQADYTSIEGAVIAWSSGEDWKLDAMRELAVDPSLPDLYRRAAAQIMGSTTDIITKKHPLRQSVGKTSELALGFGGGVAAFYSMSRLYGVNLDDIYAPVWEAADEERRERAIRRYEGCLKRKREKTDELSREAWLACELVKSGWRTANSAIWGGWLMREDAVRAAIKAPGTVVKALKFAYLVKNGFLWARLPSGRCLAYGSPKLSEQVWAKIKLEDGTWSDPEVMDRAAAEAGELKKTVQIEGSTSPRITALGVNAVTKRWERFNLYGGLLAENDTQAIARDLLVNGMLKAEAAGYPVVAHVYDEILCEVPRGYGDLGQFEKLICELPQWAEGLPLTASGWRGKRYRKD
jgi:DNA polymerase bacteriophage-type